MLTCSGVKHDLNLVTVNPAVENTCSAGVEVIGMVRYLVKQEEICVDSPSTILMVALLYLLASLSSITPLP